MHSARIHETRSSLWGAAARKSAIKAATMTATTIVSHTASGRRPRGLMAPDCLFSHLKNSSICQRLR